MPATNQLIAELQRQIKGEVLFDQVSRMLYRTDASLYEIEPEGVVVPRDKEDVRQAVELAAQHQVPLLPRGGATSLAGQTVGAAIHLDFSKYMNQVVGFDKANKWVRVQPGLVLDELNAFLRPHGLLFGPDVSTSSRANLGGMIGNNSCGAHSLIYGKTIDHVLELRCLLADGSEVVLAPVDDQGFGGEESARGFGRPDLPSGRRDRRRIPQRNRG